MGSVGDNQDWSLAFVSFAAAYIYIYIYMDFVETGISRRDK